METQERMMNQLRTQSTKFLLNCRMEDGSVRCEYVTFFYVFLKSYLNMYVFNMFSFYPFSNMRSFRNISILLISSRKKSWTESVELFLMASNLQFYFCKYFFFMSSYKAWLTFELLKNVCPEDTAF